VGDVADQLIASGGDFSNINYTQSALAGVGTFLGGKLGGKVANNWFVKTQSRAIHTRVFSRKFSALGKTMRGTSKTVEAINNVAYKNSSEVIGGLIAGGTITQFAPNRDYLRELRVPDFNDFGNNVLLNQQFNSFNWFNMGGSADEAQMIYLPEIILKPGDLSNPNKVKNHIENNGF